MSKRSEMVASTLLRHIGKIVGQELNDPRLKLVTITDVWVAPDLMFARVYYSVIGDDLAIRAAGDALRKAVPYIRKKIAPEIKARRLPALHIVYDETPAKADRIERLMNRIEYRYDSADEDPESQPQED